MTCLTSAEHWRQKGVADVREAKGVRSGVGFDTFQHFRVLGRGAKRCAQEKAGNCLCAERADHADHAPTHQPTVHLESPLPADSESMLQTSRCLLGGVPLPALGDLHIAHPFFRGADGEAYSENGLEELDQLLDESLGLNRANRRVS